MTAAPRPLVLMLGVDKYVLEACQRHDVEGVVAWGAGAHDYGLQLVPDGMTVLRVDQASSPEAVLSALHRAGLGDRRFDAVQTSDEWAMVTAGVLAGHLGARAIDPVTAVYFRDKTLQKQRVRDVGIPAALTTVIDDVHDVSDITELPYERAVLKPIAGAATAMTSVVDSVEQLRALSVKYRAERTGQRTFVLEEFIDGAEEWVADGVVFDGEMIFCALGRYGVPCLSTVDKALPLWLRRFDPGTEAWAYERAESLVARALRALDLRDGVFHMELFHDPATGTLTFGECAARRGGALVHEEVQAKFNVHLGAAALLGALGRKPELDIQVRPETIGGTYLMGRPGTLFRCPSPAEMKALPGVEHVRVEYAFGSQISSGVGSTNARIAQVLVSAESEDAMLRRFEELRTWFDERLLIAPSGGAMRELRAWQQATWPDEDYKDQLWN
jgi:biotin carboxylase